MIKLGENVESRKLEKSHDWKEGFAGRRWRTQGRERRGRDWEVKWGWGWKGWGERKDKQQSCLEASTT